MATLRILRRGPWEGEQLLVWQGSLTRPHHKSRGGQRPGRDWDGIPCNLEPFPHLPRPSGRPSGCLGPQLGKEVGFQAMAFPSLVPRRMLRRGSIVGPLPPHHEKVHACVLSFILSRLEALRGLSITPGASGIKKGHWRFLNMDQKAVKCVLKKKSRH